MKSPKEFGETPTFFDRFNNKPLDNALKYNSKSKIGVKLSNLSDIMKSKEYHHLCDYFKRIFKDLYNYSRTLETFNFVLTEEIKRLSDLNHHLYKSQNFKEKMLKTLTEQNRVLEEKCKNLQEEVAELTKLIKRRNFEKNSQSMFNIKTNFSSTPKTERRFKKGPTIVIEEEFSEEVATPIPRKKTFMKQKTSFITNFRVKKLPEISARLEPSARNRVARKSKRMSSFRAKKRKSSMAYMLTTQRKSHRNMNRRSQKSDKENNMIIMQDDKSIPSLIFRKFMVKDLINLNEEFSQISNLLMENNDNFNFLKNLSQSDNMENFIDTSGRVAVAKIKGTVTSLLVFFPQ